MQYCSVEDCKNKLKAKTYCTIHYARLVRGNDPLANTIYDRRPAIIEGNVALIPLGLNAKHGYVTVDKEFSWLDKYNWSFSHGYATNKIGLMHHIIIGKPEKGYDVDHRNHNKLDNRRNNLRIVTHHQNGMNQKNRNIEHGFKGITSEYGRWKAQIRVNNKHIHLGRYKTPVEAAIAYNKAAIEYFGEYASLNDV